MPWSVELRGARPHAISVPTGRISDRPRFAWRGAMLDVARHFFGPPELKRYIDLLAFYKFNHLHLHLSDDQGWRIEIAAWPNLTTHGGSTAVGSVRGGFYTKQDYADIVAYAGERFITVVPEIDMPSHINAALASYPELNCNGVAPQLYTGIDVGFSNFCLDKEITYKFIDDVLGETGGDDAGALPSHRRRRGQEDHARAIPPPSSSACRASCAKNGKTAIGWDEIIHRSCCLRRSIQYLAARCVDGAATGNEADSVAGEQDLSGHEVPRQRRARAELGGQRGRAVPSTTGTRRRT